MALGLTFNRVGDFTAGQAKQNPVAAEPKLFEQKPQAYSAFVESKVGEFISSSKDAEGAGTVASAGNNEESAGTVASVGAGGGLSYSA